MKLKGRQPTEKIFVPRMIKYSCTWYVHEKFKLKKESQHVNRPVTWGHEENIYIEQNTNAYPCKHFFWVVIKELQFKIKSLSSELPMSFIVLNIY